MVQRVPTSEMMVFASSPMEVSTPVPTLIALPSAASQAAMRRNPSTVSATNVKSRVVLVSPRRISPPRSACATMVGITARSDCRGPYVLNGRAIATGVSNDR